MAGVSISPSNDSSSLLKTVINATATATVAGTAGLIIRVYKLFLVVGGTTNITFQDAGTALSGPLPMVANGSIVLDMDGTPWFTTSSGNGFLIASSGSSIQVSGVVYYQTSPYS
jgi:hypothetical protein